MMYVHSLPHLFDVYMLHLYVLWSSWWYCMYMCMWCFGAAVFMFCGFGFPVALYIPVCLWSFYWTCYMIVCCGHVDIVCIAVVWRLNLISSLVGLSGLSLVTVRSLRGLCTSYCSLVFAVLSCTSLWWCFVSLAWLQSSGLHCILVFATVLVSFELHVDFWNRA